MILEFVGSFPFGEKSNLKTYLDKATRRQFQCISPFFTIMTFLLPKFKSFNLQMGEDMKQRIVLTKPWIFLQTIFFFLRKDV